MVLCIFSKNEEDRKRAAPPTGLGLLALNGSRPVSSRAIEGDIYLFKRREKKSRGSIKNALSAPEIASSFVMNRRIGEIV